MCECMLLRVFFLDSRSCVAVLVHRLRHMRDEYILLWKAEHNMQHWGSVYALLCKHHYRLQHWIYKYMIQFKANYPVAAFATNPITRHGAGV